LLVRHRVRLDTRVSSRTRIEVVTDGILLRMMQQDPSLQQVGAVQQQCSGRRPAVHCS
jgi:ATP-dependent helicase HrpB